MGDPAEIAVIGLGLDFALSISSFSTEAPIAAGASAGAVIEVPVPCRGTVEPEAERVDPATAPPVSGFGAAPSITPDVSGLPSALRFARFSCLFALFSRILSRTRLITPFFLTVPPSLRY